MKIMKKILIVDDEIEVASIFETALKIAGYNVKIAPDGKSGIDMAKSEPFDLILLDQMLPDISGNEILKRLKTDANLKNLPIALLTNFGHDTSVKEALLAGANDYILKYQISNDDLVAKVKKLFGEI